MERRTPLARAAPLRRTSAMRSAPSKRPVPKGKRTWICENCGRSFEAKVTHIGKRRFCSYACFGAAKTLTVVAECPICGREVVTTARTRRKTCSERCRNEAVARAKRGAGNPNYQGDNAAKRRWFASKAKACLMCGTTRRLQIHHVVFEQHVRAEGGDPWDPRDGVTLCLACHVSTHKAGRKPLALWMLPDAAIEFAAELYGPGAYDYLRRRYGGDDPRVTALLELPLCER
jgi:hypothetical protein